MYNIERCKNGFVVVHFCNKVKLYCDRDGLWLRSKKALTPMNVAECRNMIEKFKEEDSQRKFL